MINYVIRRLLLIVPTLVTILIMNFLIVQAVPGGPVEQAVARMSGVGGSSALGSSGQTQGMSSGGAANGGIDPKLMNEIRARYGFDKPPLKRLELMLSSYLRFDFGNSFYLGARVTDLIRQRLPVSLSLALWTTVLTYLIAIPLGIRKAIQHGGRFDAWTSTGVAISYAIPTFLFAVVLITVLAGGLGLRLFPIRGLVSDDFATLSTLQKVGDYLWHIALPVMALTLGTYATATIVTKNAFLGEIAKQYVVTARAKGMSERRILFKHVFRNASLMLITTIPQTFLQVLLGGSLLIEVLFSLDGFGRMSYEAALSRDYPVVFGALFVFTLVGMLIKLFGDLVYMLVDPRIDLSARAE